MAPVSNFDEKKFSGAFLAVFGFFLFATTLLEFIVSSMLSERLTLLNEFIFRGNASYSTGMFLVYLVVSSIGFVGVVGLIRCYGKSGSLLVDFTRLAATAWFALKYWLWAAMFIVQQKVTMLSEAPRNPPEWVLQEFDAADKFFSLGPWASVAPEILMFVGLGLLMRRGARTLPRVASWTFLLLAATRAVIISYTALQGISWAMGGMTLTMILDAVSHFGFIFAVLMASASVYTEKSVFVRGARRGSRHRDNL